MATDILDLYAPEFAPVRGELGRLYLAHKDELGLGGHDDAEIAARTDDITWYLLRWIGQAMLSDDKAFLPRFRWLTEAFDRLDQGERVTKLDG